MKSNSLAKRALALALSMVMCVGMLQITALAVEEADSNVSSWDVTLPNGNSVEVTGSKTDESWSGKSEDGKVTVDGSFEVRSEESSTPTPNEDKSFTNESSSVVTEDENGRPLTETGSKEDVSSSDVIDTKVTEEKETITETETSQSEWTDNGIKDTIQDPNGPSTEPGKETNDSYVPDDETLKASGSVSWNGDGSADNSKGSDTQMGDISKENQKLKPDLDFVTGKEPTKIDGQNTWSKSEDIEGGTKKTTVTEKVDKAGNVIGYETVVEIVTTKKGDTVESVKEELENTDTSKNTVTDSTGPVDTGYSDAQQTIELPEKPEVGSAFTHTDSQTGTVTSVTEILDGNNKVIGYKVETTFETTDENGTVITKTQTEDVYGKVIDNVTTGRTEQVDTTTETTNKKDTYEVTGERKDEVTTVTTVTTTGATADNNNEGLKVTVVADAISGKQHDEILDTLTLGNDDKVDVNDVGEAYVRDIVNDAVEFKCFVGTTVNVSQKKVSDSLSYDATMNIQVQLSESQLANGDLVLEVKAPNGQTTSYRLAGAASQGEVVLTPDKSGNFSIEHSGITSNTFELNLTGKQKFLVDYGNDDQIDENGKHKQELVYAHIDLKTNIKVDITEFKVSTATKETTTTEKHTNVVAVSAEKTVDTTTTEKTTITTENTYKTITETQKNKWDTTYVYNDPTPEQPEEGGTGGGGGGTGGGGGGGTGGGGGDTPVIDVPDPEVPLADLPETPEEPEEEVIIPDEDVPLAEGPEEVDILDEDVPLAAVPQTGDISSLWYLATLASACGLGALTLRKKED